MEPSEDFFSGDRYAIFGATARGRTHGGILIAALRKAGKSAVAIEPAGTAVKGAEIVRSLADAGKVDGIVVLPPSPWDADAAQFAADAARQCREQGVARVWIYTAQMPGPAAAIAEQEGLDPVAGKCPCLYIIGGGFPHNLHRSIARLLKRF